MLHPVRGIASDARKLNELLCRVQLVVGVGIFDSQQHIRAKTRFRMITVLHHIQCAMKKRHALREAPSVRDEFHGALGRLTRCRWSNPEEPHSLIRRINSSFIIKAHGHPRTLFARNRIDSFHNKAIMYLDRVCRSCFAKSR